MVQKKIDIKNIARDYLIALPLVLAIDLTWILIIMNSFYQRQLAGFARPESVPLWSAAFAWALIPLGIVLFVIPLSKTKVHAIIYGAFFGLILYGVYDFTNYATLAGWTLSMLIVDILWGTFLCSVSSLILKTVLGRWF